MPIKIVERKNNELYRERAKQKYKKLKDENETGWVIITKKQNAELYKKIRDLIISCKDWEMVVYRKIPKNLQKRVEAAMDAVING
jgi:hypothetical protein